MATDFRERHESRKVVVHGEIESRDPDAKKNNVRHTVVAAIFDEADSVLAALRRLETEGFARETASPATRRSACLPHARPMASASKCSSAARRPKVPHSVA